MITTRNEQTQSSRPRPSSAPENRLVAGHPMEAQCDLGVVGLSAMGRSLLLNLQDKGFQVAGYDEEEQNVTALRKEANGRRISAHSELETFFKSLRRPRAVLLLVTRSDAADSVSLALRPHLEAGDLIVDSRVEEASQ